MPQEITFELHPLSYIQQLEQEIEDNHPSRLSSEDYESLKYYLPALVMIAVTLTESGSPDLFTNLYPTDMHSTSFSGFLSSNLINGLATVGILLQSLIVSAASGSITLGLVTGIIIFFQ